MNTCGVIQVTGCPRTCTPQNKNGNPARARAPPRVRFINQWGGGYKACRTKLPIFCSEFELLCVSRKGPYPWVIPSLPALPSNVYALLCYALRCSPRIVVSYPLCRGEYMESYFFFYLTYSRRTSSSLPSFLWSLRIFPSLPGSRLTIFYRDASSALLQLVNQWLNFPYSRSHAFRYGRKNTNPALVRIELTTSALAGVQVTY